MALTNQEILDAIAEKTVMEIVELISAMEEKFGVSAAALAAAPAAGGDAGGRIRPADPAFPAFLSHSPQAAGRRATCPRHGRSASRLFRRRNGASQNQGRHAGYPAGRPSDPGLPRRTGRHAADAAATAVETKA